MVERIEGVAFAESLVGADGYRLRCLEAGAGEPVLRIHGENGLSLTRMDALLSQNHRLIVMELPGLSDAADERHLPARDLGHSMVAVTQGLGLRRYSVIASSQAAAAALWQTLEDAENVDALVLLAPAAIVPPGWRPPAGERVRSFANDGELERRLPEIDVPTLVIFGTADRVVPPEAGRVYRKTMPNCSFAFMYDAGHAIETDRPEAAAELVGDFLERHELFVVARETSVVNP